MDTTHREQHPQYTCLIRLPFPRGDFVDPPPVEWDDIKDRALWKLISQAANSKDLDWPALSQRFDVSLPFLLQQAAWLYERHFAQMRAQMKKLGTSSAPSPVPPPDGQAAAQRPVSRSSRPRSALSTHSRDSPLPQAAASQVAGGSSRPGAPPMSRTPSTTTVTQSRHNQPQSPRPDVLPSRALRPSFTSSARRPASFADELSPPVASPTTGPVLSSSEDDDDRPAYRSVAKSQVFRRPPDLRAVASDGDAEDDDDDDSNSSGGFLPFASRNEGASGRHASSLRSNAQPGRRSGAAAQRAAATATSSAGAAAMPSTVSRSRGGPGSTSDRDRPPPAQHQPSARPSIRQAATVPHAPASVRPSAEATSPQAAGTPSMGSSFSDLDVDSGSVTRSALEDALLSNMRQGGSLAGRMSTLGNAIKSRYLAQ